MCRILMVKSKEDFNINHLASFFAQKCRKSNKWQGDGWGVCWLNSTGQWEVKKSLSPIWEEISKLDELPKSKVFLIHARSASFPKHKGSLQYNQPYINGNIAFVFNGFINGVRLKEKIRGEIGAQKIFNLINRNVSKAGLNNSIRRVQILIEKNSEKIEGLNIGICDRERLYALCRYSENEDYFTLRYFKDEAKIIICSEELPSLAFRGMQNDQLLVS